MGKFVDRTGEVSIATNGMKMQIIEYRGTKDIDIMFEDGIVVKNKTYQEFKKGSVRYPITDRVGEIKIATNGMKMKIIAYRSFHDIDIMFEDGTVAKNRTYRDFKTSNIKYPLPNRVGEIRIATNGMKMQVIAYRNADDIDIRFEDGTVIKNKTYDSFKKGCIKNPNFENGRVGEEIITKDGIKMKLVAYRSATDVDIMFEDGSIVCNKSYSNFKKGYIGILDFKHKMKLGEEKIANNGMKMVLIAYRSCRDVDVRFEDGVVVKNKTYNAFNSGSIRHPTVSCTRAKKEKERVGEIVVSKNGLRMRIINYRTVRDLDIQFEDGTIIKNKRYESFKDGATSHPMINLFPCNSVKGVFYNYTLKAIAYKKGNEVYYICEDRYGNKDILTPQQMLEKSGIKPVF